MLKLTQSKQIKNKQNYSKFKYQLKQFQLTIFSIMFWNIDPAFYLLSFTNICIIKMNCQIALHQFTSQFSQAEVKQALQSANKMYNIKFYDICKIDIEEALHIFKGIQEKFYRNDQVKATMKWLQNQLRIFVWCLCCYIHQNSMKIQDMSSGNWYIIQQIFKDKSESLFNYQAHLIVQHSQKPKVWSLQEDNVLTEIMSKLKKNAKWNQISKEIFIASNGKIIRNPKQCRERWNNHIDPNKVKGSWKISQCLQMFEFVKQNGRKWAKLVKIFNSSRDQHSIKNKYNSLFRKQRKMVSCSLTDTQVIQCIINRLKRLINTYNDESMQENDVKIQQQDIIEQKQSNNYSNIIRKKLLGIQFSNNAQDPKSKNKPKIKIESRLSYQTMPSISPVAQFDQKSMKQPFEMDFSVQEPNSLNIYSEVEQLNSFLAYQSDLQL